MSKLMKRQSATKAQNNLSEFGSFFNFELHVNMLKFIQHLLRNEKEKVKPLDKVKVFIYENGESFKQESFEKVRRF